MQNSHKALWDNCLHLIKQNVTEQTFKTWFEPIVFESYNEEQKTVLVQVPSPYVYEYLEQYYVRLMAWALSNSFKTNVRLTYRLMTDKEHKLTQDVVSEQPRDV
jgi:chromosomal replication initiator protein